MRWSVTVMAGFSAAVALSAGCLQTPESGGGLEALEREHAAAVKDGRSRSGLTIEPGRWGTPLTIGGWDVHLAVPGDTNVGRARAFLSRVADDLRVDPASLVVHRDITRPDGASAVSVQQHANGLPVWRALATLRFDADKRLTSYRGLLVPEDVLPSPEPTLTAREAAAIAATDGREVVGQTLGYFSGAHFGLDWDRVHLAWENRTHDDHRYVDALTGVTLHVDATRDHYKHIEVYHHDGSEFQVQYDDLCHGGSDIPAPSDYCPLGFGCPGGPCQNPATTWPGSSKLAWENVTFIYNAQLWSVGMDSWDGAGARIHLTTEYNAECAGSWGYPDMEIGPNSACIDLIGHEYGHAVNDGTAPGSDGILSGTDLNEGFSDALGELYQGFKYGSFDWVTLTSPGCGGNCSEPRSLIDPASQGRPDNFASFWATGAEYDNGRVVGKLTHLLGRPASDGAVTHWGVSVTGVGADRIHKVLLYAVTSCLGSTPTFTELGDCVVTEACAMTSYPEACARAQAAVDAVGIWRPDFNPGGSSSAPLVEGTVSFATRVEAFNGVPFQRRYLFYRAYGSQNINYISTLCATGPTCAWASPQPLGVSTPYAPATARVGSTIWTCAPGSSGAVACRTMQSDGTILTNYPGVTTDAKVALAEYDGALYLFYKQAGLGARPLAYKKRPAGGGVWSSATTTLYNVYGAPAIASGTMDNAPNVANGLWVAYTGPSGASTRLVLRRFDPASGALSVDELADHAAGTLNGQVALAMWRGRLQLAARQSNGTIKITSCTMPCTAASHWTRWVQQDLTGGAEEVALSGVDTKLHLFRRVDEPSLNARVFIRSRVGE